MVEKIENMEPPIAHMIPEGSGHILLPVISFIALLTLDWRIALDSLVTVPLSLVFMTLTMIISGKSFTQYDESNEHMNSTIVEYIEGIEVIKAFGRAGTSYEKYAKAILDYKKSISQLVLAVMLSMSMVTSFAKIEVFSENLREMQYNIESIQDFLTMKELPEPSVYANINSYDVKLENVHFSYTGKEKDEVLHGIDLTMPAGSFTALVGPSGGGKSTVARLISRFWDVTSGGITICDVNIREMPLSQLSEMISFVTQDNFLFRCSILENIRLGNPTVIGEGGGSLSGGEKQRISIARAILKDAPIIILDEATASVDPENEHLIQAAISELTKGKTIVTIAHRLATIEQADQILVVDNGQIVQRGTHRELVVIPGKYKDFVDIRSQSEGWKIG